MRDQNIILFIFAGREANMEVQKPYLDRLLETYPNMELHLWDLTRTSADADYLQTRAGAHDGRVKVLRHFHPGHPIRCMYPKGRQRLRGYPPCVCLKHKPPYEQPYKFYAASGQYRDTIFVKVDDDVLFLETEKFDDLIDPLLTRPSLVMSANVINNAVAAKYEPGLTKVIRDNMGVGDPQYSDSDRQWWELHTMPEFARFSHTWFLMHQDTTVREQPDYIKTRLGEAISINCITFTHRTMLQLAEAFASDPRLGDEGVVDSYLPTIALSFHAAHLSFGPQEAVMTNAELDSIREAYEKLAKEYLG